MENYQPLLEEFVQRSKEIIRDGLVGVYLHGSAVMGCFNPKESDLDLLIVVKTGLSDAVKLEYLKMILELNARAPAKGLELSVVTEDVCDSFVYPTPYEFHFSNGHLDRCRADPQGYVREMKGTDKDLAAHFTITLHRGRTLYGREIGEVFGPVDSRYYFDSILYDIENAEAEIVDAPVYLILNLCRVLAYKKAGLILSKREGGDWGLENLPEQFRPLISGALAGYAAEGVMEADPALAREYARYMLGEITAE